MSSNPGNFFVLPVKGVCEPFPPPEWTGDDDGQFDSSADGEVGQLQPLGLFGFAVLGLAAFVGFLLVGWVKRSSTTGGYTPIWEDSRAGPERAESERAESGAPIKVRIAA